MTRPADGPARPVPRAPSTVRTGTCWMSNCSRLDANGEPPRLPRQGKISKGKLKKRPPNPAFPLLPRVRQKEGRVWAWATRNSTEHLHLKEQARAPRAVPVLPPALALLQGRCWPRDVSLLGPPVLPEQGGLTSPHVTGSVAKLGPE